MRARGLALVCVLTACGTPQPEPESPPVIIADPTGDVPETPSLASSEPSPPRDPDMPPPLRVPSHPACVLHGKEVRMRLKVRLAAGGPEALSASPAEATLWLPRGSRLQGASVELAESGVRLRGVVSADDLRLSPARAERLAGYVLLKPTALLRWLDAREGHATVQLDPHFSDVTYAAAPKGEVDCAALSLDQARFDARASLSEGPLLHWGRLTSGEVRLLDAPAGRLLATVTIGDGAPDGVAVHALRDRHARVVYESDAALLLGWVEAAQVTQVADQPLSARGWGTGSGAGSRHVEVRKLRCDESVRIALRLADREADPREATVGEVDAGVLIEQELPVEGKLSSIRLPEARWFRLSFRSQLLAKTSVLASCRDAE